MTTPVVGGKGESGVQAFETKKNPTDSHGRRLNGGEGGILISGSALGHGSLRGNSG